MKWAISSVVLLVLSQLGSATAADQRDSYASLYDDNPSDHQPKYYTLPPLREQAALQDAWTKERRAGVPKILQKYGVDAWLISQREYAEETVFWSFKSAKEFSARRRTTILFLANATKGTPTEYTWVDNTPDIWQSIKEVLSKQNPTSIAIDNHPQIAFSSGLHAGELDAINEGLGKEWASRFVSEPMIAVEYIATMPESRAEWYGKLQSTAWAMISEAFSERVIKAGVTTTADVEWWLRSKIQEMNYTTWFHPSVSIIDQDAWNISSSSTTSPSPDSGFSPEETTTTIQPAALLHVDFGVTALGLNTDTQHLAYVLPSPSSPIPPSLLAGLHKANRAQDIVLSHMKVGRTGNEILNDILAQFKVEDISGRVYSHPIGDWGHSAGTLIGMTNLQEGVPVLGEMKLLRGMYYSVELMVEHFVEELNATLRFPVEEDVRWESGEEGRWVWAFEGGRQVRFHVVRPGGEKGGEVNGDEEGGKKEGWRLNVQGGDGRGGY